MTVADLRPSSEDGAGDGASVGPRLSLVISTIGRPEPLCRFLDTLVVCPRVDEIELIVVDQSPDQCARQVLEDRAATLPFPARVITSGIGASYGRNVGLAAATGELVAFPDDDCWYAPDVIARVLQAFEDDPDLDVLSGQARTDDDRPSCLRWARERTVVTPSNIYRTSICFTLFCRRQPVVETKGFDVAIGPGAGTWYGAGEEADLVLRLLADGRRVVYDPELIVHHAHTYDLVEPATVDKMFVYGCGEGHVWALHDIARTQIVHRLVRKSGIGVYRVLRGRWVLSNADFAWVRGCVAGLRDRPPRGHTRSDPITELRRSYSIRTVVAFIGLLASFALTVTAVRQLDDREAATFLSILAALMIGPLIGRFGLGTRSMQLLSNESGRPDEGIVGLHVWMTAAVTAVVALPVALLSTVPLAGRSSRWPVVALAAALVVVEAVRLTVSDIFSAMGRIGWSVTTTHSIRAIAAAGVVGVVLATGTTLTLERLVVVQLVVAGVLLLVGLHRLTASSRVPRPATFRPIVLACQASIAFLGVDLAEFVAGRADVWLSAWAFPADQAIRYSTASVLAAQVAVPVGLVNVALGPTVARLWRLGLRDELRSAMDAISTLATVFTTAVVAVLWVLGPELLAAVYGDELRAAGSLTAILATGLLAYGAFGTCIALLVLTDHARQAASAALAVLVVATPVAILVAFVTGPTGLAVASAATSVALAGSQALMCRRCLGFAPVPRLDVAAAVRTLRSGMDLPETLVASGVD